jgi:hypothetical protein
MRNKEQVTVISREGGNVSYHCKCMGADNQVWKESTFTAPTYEEAKRKCAIFCRGKEASSTSSQKFNNFTSGRTGKRFRKHSGSDLFPNGVISIHEYDFGCTIPSAFNYNPTSTSEEGNCLWYDESVGSGNVMSSYLAACNWNEEDGYYLNHDHVNEGANPIYTLTPYQCPYINYGCTDPSADNYNPSADQDFTASPPNGSTTLCVYDGQVSGLTSDKNPKKGGKRFRNQSGDWGGISFQCDETPFTSATGNKEILLGGGGDRAEGGKKNYTCKCILAGEGGEAIFIEHTISAWSSLAAGRRCKRMGRSCYLVSAYGT